MEALRIKCTSIGVYEHALTRGKVYEVVDEDENKFRILGDHGRRVWISKYNFVSIEESVLIMKTWQFDDDIDKYELIEVTITFDDDSKRWCVITTPQKIVEYFDNELMNPPGINMKHLIIMKTTRAEDVEKMLKHLDNQNELIEVTKPLLEG
ncbi:hypothetical protein SAMN04488542_101333 [Fontibacillus panacisegetis]|uniref:Uncharacterized protein n=1 Tax=Fontibacillus panacisegetis TaxID=670482 RepID=A0A1G7ETV2_9BACL|nr:hypothetical protein [Fontibacillus panacisegetis]SDE67032.1 hypothetical protein SAMN04488542_101333 [Fontibacillus panacisegetis]